MTPTENQDASRRKGRVIIVAIVLATLVVVGISLFTNLTRLSSQAVAQKAGPTGQKLELLEIQSGSNRHRFSVEVMRSDADRARGLMFRQSMPADQGMLFDFERDNLVTMWMKNTFIPLDMVFTFADGRIHRIESRTEPQSERVISSGVPVRAVLEINAGVAEKLGLKPGDKITHAMFR